MQLLWFLNILVLIGLCQGDLETTRQHLPKLRRYTRAAFQSMGDSMMTVFEAKIISECKITTHSTEIETKLQNIISKLKACLGKKMLYLTPKDEYLDNIDECAKDIITETKSCLQEKHRYLPDLIKQFTKNLVVVLYDDIDIIKESIGTCMLNFQRLEVQKNYIQCVTDVAVSTKASVGIPDTVEDYCNTFLPAHRCFGKTMKKYCDDTDQIEKFRSDYVKAGEDACSYTMTKHN